MDVEDIVESKIIWFDRMIPDVVYSFFVIEDHLGFVASFGR